MQIYTIHPIGDRFGVRDEQDGRYLLSTFRSRKQAERFAHYTSQIATMVRQAQERRAMQAAE
jgi:hypothetical protein